MPEHRFKVVIHIAKIGKRPGYSFERGFSDRLAWEIAYDHMLDWANTAGGLCIVKIQAFQHGIEERIWPIQADPSITKRSKK